MVHPDQIEFDREGHELVRLNSILLQSGHSGTTCEAQRFQQRTEHACPEDRLNTLRSIDEYFWNNTQHRHTTAKKMQRGEGGRETSEVRRRINGHRR
jgi:hypothetical protein